jgi:hypothetical protein
VLSGTLDWLSIRSCFPLNRHVGQAILGVCFQLCARSLEPGLAWSLGLRRVSLRETGWSRNPSVRGPKPRTAGQALRVVVLAAAITGQATYGVFRQHAGSSLTTSNEFLSRNFQHAEPAPTLGFASRCAEFLIARTKIVQRGDTEGAEKRQEIFRLVLGAMF